MYGKYFAQAGTYMLSIYGSFDYTKIFIYHISNMSVFSFMAFGFGSCLESPSPFQDIKIFS